MSSPGLGAWPDLVGLHICSFVVLGRRLWRQDGPVARRICVFVSISRLFAHAVAVNYRYRVCIYRSTWIVITDFQELYGIKRGGGQFQAGNIWSKTCLLYQYRRRYWFGCTSRVWYWNLCENRRGSCSWNYSSVSHYAEQSRGSLRGQATTWCVTAVPAIKSVTATSNSCCVAIECNNVRHFAHSVQVRNV